jgi:hypothetical protein
MHKDLSDLRTPHTMFGLPLFGNGAELQEQL